VLMVLGFVMLAGIVWECYKQFGEAAPFGYVAVVIVVVLPFGW
jgi:hypothetical protein